jgi:hypothetical protein
LAIRRAKVAFVGHCFKALLSLLMAKLVTSRDPLADPAHRLGHHTFTYISGVLLIP